jgi:hypothetical protein
VKQLAGVTILGLLLSGGVLGADQQGKSKEHGNAKQGPANHVVAGAKRDGRSLAVQVAWSPRDVGIIRTHYAPRYRNLPPGLRKKYARNGQLPPGWQMKMKPLAASLAHEWAPLPAGYRRGIIDAQAVIYNSRGTVMDVAILF